LDEAIKAQAISVRSYTYRKLQTKTHTNADMCTDINHCQAWKKADNSQEYKRICQLVEETRGKVAVHNNEVINAVYHASSGGYTEEAVNVWNGSNVEYLQSVKSDGEEKIMKNFETVVEINREEVFNKLKLKETNKIEILSRTDGKRVKELLIGKSIFTGNEIREIFNLRSSNFEIIDENKKIKFVVKGYGHGVGMSQTGADSMAKEGKTAEDIINHFYKNVEIRNINSL
jgi:stage II sporulation protein D